MVRYLPFIVATTLAAPGCAAPLKTVGEPRISAQEAAAGPTEASVSSKTTPLNQRFETLDDYLAYREKRGAIDGSWYREIRPGVYRLETGNYHGPETEQRIFTREELLRKYGFDE